MPNVLNFGNKVIFLNGNPLTLPVAADDPASATNGDMYYNSTADKVKVYQAGTWVFLTSGSSVSYSVNKFTLSSDDITNKFVTLTGIPNAPSDTILDIVGGVMQSYAVDFTVSGDVLSWDSLGLDGVLVVGDKLIVQFD